MNIGNRRQAEVGFLQTHAAGFQAQYRLSRNTVAVIFRRQLQRRRHFGAGHLAHTAALERAFYRYNNSWFAVNGAFRHHHAVIGLRDDALRAEPRRHHAFKRVEQFTVAAFVQQRLCALTRF